MSLSRELSQEFSYPLHKGKSESWNQIGKGMEMWASIPRLGDAPSRINTLWRECGFLLSITLRGSWCWKRKWTQDDKLISEPGLKGVQVSSKAFFIFCVMWDNVFWHERQSYRHAWRSLRGTPEIPSGLLLLRVSILNSSFYSLLYPRATGMSWKPY